MQRIWVGIILAALFGLLVVSAGSAQPAANQTTSFINVGQGDSALIQDGSGFDVLIDGGVAAAGDTVTQFLRDHGAADLEVMLASHADADHIGGLIAVLQAPDITTHAVLYNGYPGTTATWNNFVAAAAARGMTLTPVQFPSVLTWGGMTAYVLNPAAGLSSPATNDASVVVRLDYGQVRELFTGDIGAAVEATVVARQTPVAAELLKVPHHGSASSSSAAFPLGGPSPGRGHQRGAQQLRSPISGDDRPAPGLRRGRVPDRSAGEHPGIQRWGHLFDGPNRGTGTFIPACGDDGCLAALTHPDKQLMTHRTELSGARSRPPGGTCPAAGRSSSAAAARCRCACQTGPGGG